MLQKVGFADAQMIAETGFNSTHKTRGTLFRAAKAASIVAEKNKSRRDSLSKYQE